MQCMAHSEGEKATVRATIQSRTIMILSSLSTTSLEDLARAAREELTTLKSASSKHSNTRTVIPTTSDIPGVQLMASSSSSATSSDPLPYQDLRWFQLYVYRDREITRQLVQRAEKEGYQTLVLTVDTPQLGHREADARNAFALPSHLSLANFTNFKFSTEHIGTKAAGVSGLKAYVGELFDRALSWKDIAWLRSITKLPVVVKGILTKEDTELAIKAGVDGIVVSNHGARQLDGVAATIDALSEVAQAVKDCNSKVEVYMDGGIRRGTDVFKALALGARCVFIGRPILWGLACNGADGVSHVLNILHNELELAMSLAGCPTISSINKAYLATAETLRPKL